MLAAADQTMSLCDGRTLGWAEFGDADGFPVINAHGGLACRLDVAAAAEAATAAGVRLLSPDRPGIGRSDAQPGRTILDWARDAAELADHLAIDRFAVMGWSMGGQYAAALGYLLPLRVARAAIIAGALPLTEPGVFEQLPLMDRAYTRLSQRVAPAARLCFRAMHAAARYAPNAYGRLAAGELGEADAAVLRDDGYGAFAQMSAEALRRPGGVVDDYRAWMRPWGFAPEDLAVPVEVWAGTDDELVNREWPHLLAERIPGAQLKIRSGGHFVAHLHYPEIFEALSAD
jgi:pimeloyl-ACP methyl ester carboxylesterase